MKMRQVELAAKEEVFGCYWPEVLEREARFAADSSHPSLISTLELDETTSLIGTFPLARLTDYKDNPVSAPVVIARGAAEDSCRRIRIIVPDKIHNGFSLV